MGYKTSIFALAAAGAFVASVGAIAAQVDRLPGAFQQVALVGPAPNLGAANGPRDVIEPPSSVDPGMAIDPPQTGAKMPVIRPQPGPPGGGVIVPR
jgi:hypothetical protein